MFTDSMGSTAKGSRKSHDYAVSTHVRVREEAFGLLFYNTQNNKLTFVRSEDLFRIQSLPRGRKTVTAACKAADRLRAEKILDHLAKRGLLFEA